MPQDSCDYSIKCVCVTDYDIIIKPYAVFARIVQRVVGPNKGRKKGVSVWVGITSSGLVLL